MFTYEEKRRDIISEFEFDAREREIDSRRLDYGRLAHALKKRGAKLRNRLMGLDPKSEATAELTGAMEDLEEDAQWVQYGLYQLVSDALLVVTEDGEVEYAHTPADVKAWCDRAVEMGAVHPQIDSRQLRDLVRMRQVPNARFREAYGSSTRSPTDIMIDAWRELRKLEEADLEDYGSSSLMKPGGRPDELRFCRLLGLQTVPNGNGKSGLRIFIPYEIGVAFMRALAMTPQEAGL